MKKLVDVYAYRLTLQGVQLLILRRSANTIYGGQWRMIGGKVHSNEHRVDAALRELNEETGLYPNKLWTLPSVNHFYESETDELHLIPAFGAELPADCKPVLNYEHCEYKWVQVDELSAYINWPEQLRLMQMLEAIVSEGRIIPEWMISNFKER